MHCPWFLSSVHTNNQISALKHALKIRLHWQVRYLVPEWNRYLVPEFSLFLQCFVMMFTGKLLLPLVLTRYIWCEGDLPFGFKIKLRHHSHRVAQDQRSCTSINSQNHHKNLLNCLLSFCFLAMFKQHFVKASATELTIKFRAVPNMKSFTTWTLLASYFR